MSWKIELGKSYVIQWKHTKNSLGHSPNGSQGLRGVEGDYTKATTSKDHQTVMQPSCRTQTTLGCQTNCSS